MASIGRSIKRILFIRLEDDPYYFKMSKKEAIIHNPRILIKDSFYIMYYDYGAGANNAISMATSSG